MQNGKVELKEYNVENLKVGVISDSQITPCYWKDRTVFENNLIAALETLKANACNVIIFAGDICNKASKNAYKRYRNCFDKVFGADMPIVQHIMGNHDYLRRFGNRKHCRKLFTDMLGQEPFTHYVINGYHFIGVSCCNASMTDAYREAKDWINENIETAEKDGGGKPIFVTTHNSPKGTVYGSDDWGDIGLSDIFEKHPRVVNISGHLHYSLLDERSFFAGKFIAFSTQSVSYLELEQGKENGTIPPMAYECPMGHIIDFSDNKITVHRYDMKNNAELKKESVWQIYPKPQKNNISFDKPFFEETECRYELVNDLTRLVFSRAKCSDTVHTYKLTVENGKEQVEQYYFSDFYLGGQREKEQRLTLYNLARGFYDIKIQAVNSHGEISGNYIEIQGVPVIKKTKYRKIQSPEKRNAWF